MNGYKVPHPTTVFTPLLYNVVKSGKLSLKRGRIRCRVYHFATKSERYFLITIKQISEYIKTSRNIKKYITLLPKNFTRDSFLEFRQLINIKILLPQKTTALHNAAAFRFYVWVALRRSSCPQ